METEAATHTPAAATARGFSSVMSVLVIHVMSVLVIRDMQRERGAGGQRAHLPQLLAAVALMSQGHIYLNCSLTEAFCIAILEAAAALSVSAGELAHASA